MEIQLLSFNNHISSDQYRDADQKPGPSSLSHGTGRFFIGPGKVNAHCKISFKILKNSQFLKKNFPICATSNVSFFYNSATMFKNF